MSSDGGNVQPVPGLGHVRIGIRAKVTILFPEETFSPTLIDGITEDLSPTGMRIRCDDVREDLYGKTLKQVRFAKVDLEHPLTGENLLLRGRVVWVDYNNRATPPCCTFGIAIEDDDEEGRDALQQIVLSVVRQMGGPTS